MEATIPPPASTPTPTSDTPAKSRAALWIALWALVCLTCFGSVIGFAILIPTIGKVRERARQTVDGSNVRQIVQGSLIWANTHGEQMPPVKLTSDGQARGTGNATIHAVACALARDGGLNEAAVWFSASDQARPVTDADPALLTVVLDPSRKIVDADFSRQQTFAWDFATGLTMDEAPTTPIAWTRGLREDGTWDPATGVYGDTGGHVAFVGGNVKFYRNFTSERLRRPDGTPTRNILETLPTNARVVGSGPGTLNGRNGFAEP